MPEPKPPTTIEQAPAPEYFVLQCPNEIILKITSYLELRHVYALLQLSQDLHAVMRKPFYDRISTICRDRSGPSLTMLEWAAQKGYSAVIQEFQTRKHVFVPGIKDLAICMAAAHGHLSCINTLLNIGAVISPSCYTHLYQRCTPLQWAAKKGDLAMVEFLLERGAAPKVLSCEHLTALDFALMNDHEECVMPMLEKGTRSKLETFLNKAVRFGHSGIVWLLLEKGMGVDIKGLDGRTVLQNALMGDRKCLPVLIDHGTCARPEILLHIAMMSGDVSLLQPLQIGANPTSKHGGKNAYYEALVYKNHHVLKELLKSRVGAEGRTFDRRTVLHYAAHLGNEEIVRLLLANGANASAKDITGFRPLHYAAGAWAAYFECRKDLIESRLRIIELLLEKGAQVSNTNNFGWNALDYARCLRNVGNHWRIVSFLEQKQD